MLDKGQEFEEIDKIETGCYGIWTFILPTYTFITFQ